MTKNKLSSHKTLEAVSQWITAENFQEVGIISSNLVLLYIYKRKLKQKAKVNLVRKMGISINFTFHSVNHCSTAQKFIKYSNCKHNYWRTTLSTLTCFKNNTVIFNNVKKLRVFYNTRKACRGGTHLAHLTLQNSPHQSLWYYQPRGRIMQLYNIL